TSKPSPLEGGGLGGGEGSRLESRSRRRLPSPFGRDSANTPIPGPSPLEGEGRASGSPFRQQPLRRLQHPLIGQVHHVLDMLVQARVQRLELLQAARAAHGD